MRLVVKVGTSLIAPGGRIDTTRMRALVDQLDLSRHEYLIVSSGAIASGMAHLGLSERPATVPLMQACAAVGQSLLMHTYEQLFFGKKVVAQLLLSSDDFTSPVRYRNLQNALHELLKLGVVPVVNENDSVSVRELVGAFGDNDELSALLATAVKADWLLLLTDVDGFYVPNGKRPRLLRTVRKLTAAHGSGLQRQRQAGHGRHALQAARRQAGQRSRRQRRHRQWTPRAGHSLGARAQDRNLFSAAAQKVFRWQLASGRQPQLATSFCGRRQAAARLAQLTTAEKNALLAGDGRRDCSQRRKHY